MGKSPVEAFMEALGNDAVTFSDVSLVTAYADFLPDQADISTRFSRTIALNIPFVSAAMDTVTESGMAIAIARLGGIGVIHKNLPPAQQAREVMRVKHYLNGLIAKPVTFRSGMRISEIMAEKARNSYPFSGFPIVDSDGRLVGLFTARDMKFITDYDVRVDDVMTANPVVGSKGTTMIEAFEIMLREKKGKLPIVDADGRLCGLYSFHDVRMLLEGMEPEMNRDPQHQLRVAAAVSPYDEARIAAVAEAGVDAIVIDTAHGHSKGVIETIAIIKNAHPSVDVVAGNVGTEAGARALLRAGVDAVKVGIGPGSICTTRIVAGVGVPQLTAIYWAAKAVQNEIPVIADGGITYSGDVAKALAAGASCAMMGSAFAGTEESPGERILHQGRTFVVYRGMGSMDAMKSGMGSRERYDQGHVVDTSKLVPQGIEGLIPYRGALADVLHQFAGGVRFSLGYCGARTIPQLQATARFVRVTAAGKEEAHPHDVKMLKDAPNYWGS